MKENYTVKLIGYGIWFEVNKHEFTFDITTNIGLKYTTKVYMDKRFKYGASYIWDDYGPDFMGHVINFPPSVTKRIKTMCKGYLKDARLKTKEVRQKVARAARKRKITKAKERKKIGKQKEKRG